MPNLNRVRVLNNKLINDPSPVEPPPPDDPLVVDHGREPWWYLDYTFTVSTVAPADLPEVLWLDLSMAQADLDDPTLAMKIRVQTSEDGVAWRDYWSVALNFGPNKGKGGTQTTSPYFGVRALQAEGKVVRAEFTVNKPVRVSCWLESTELRGGAKRV